MTLWRTVPISDKTVYTMHTRRSPRKGAVARGQPEEGHVCLAIYVIHSTNTAGQMERLTADKILNFKMAAASVIGAAHLSSKSYFSL